MGIIYSISDDLILNGDTAIWRCYGGKRFSEDLDFYSNSFNEKLLTFQRQIESHGLFLSKLKDTGNVIFSNVSNDNANVKVEINHVSNVRGTRMAYELTDGSGIEVLSLTPDQFVYEKILAYKNKKYIRDLFDIYHLVNSCELPESTKLSLIGFLNQLESPVDEEILKTIIYSGLAPSLDGMRQGILRRVK